METSQLEEIVSQIRQGREEDGSLEWHRAFWKVKEAKGVGEFLKDITGLANSTDPPEVRHIILGVKGSRLYKCELPEDEANLQQRIAVITPQPTVRFERHEVNGTPLVVVAIHPPFNRPYVAKLNSDHFVWVRTGSRTGTASRYHLDSFYQNQSPKPSLALTWIDEGDLEQPVLELPSLPDLDPNALLEEVKANLPGEEEIESFRKQYDLLFDVINERSPLRLGLDTHESKAKEILAIPLELTADLRALAGLGQDNPRELLVRYNFDSRSVPLRFQLTNHGTAPAEGIVIHLSSPNQYCLFSKPLPGRETLPVDPKRLKLTTTLLAWAANPGRFLAHAKLQARYSPDSFVPSYMIYDLLAPIEPPGVPSNIFIHPILRDGDRCEISSLSKLKHGFNWISPSAEISGSLRLIGMLSEREEAEIEYSIHADNLPEPCRGTLKVRADASG